MFSVRTEARCLGLTEGISVKHDLLTASEPVTLSMRQALQFIHQHRCRPDAPSFLQLTEPAKASGTMSLSWRDRSDNEDGFRVRFRGRRSGFEDHDGSKTVAASPGDEQRTVLSGLQQGFEYTLTVVAFNAVGESRPSEPITRSIPIDEDGTGENPAEETRQVELQREDVVMGFIPYLGRFPAGGVVRTGHLLNIHFPSVGPTDRALIFPKRGKSTASCGSQADVVVLAEGGGLEGDDIREIFGVAEPEFSTLTPLVFVACLTTPGLPPPFVTVRITVRFTAP